MTMFRSLRTLGLSLAFAAALHPQAIVAQAGPDRPNVVLIIADDMGWADLGSYGGNDVRTPNIDRLAAQGIRYTDFYANAVLCSPTRAGLITGRYQQRYGVEMALSSEGSTGGVTAGLPSTGHSLGHLLKSAGYATALVGKWHLGYTPETSPGAHGFDFFWGLKSGYHDYWQHTDGRGNADLWENDTPVRDSGYTTDLITSNAIDFITRSAGEPFFIDVAYNAPHWPYQRPDAPTVARGNARALGPADSSPGTRADYVAMVERPDQGVGHILAALDTFGLTNNTLVIFTNDNGAEVPAAVRLEGMDLLPHAEGRVPVSERTLFWRTTVGNRSMKAVRQGDHKLVVDANHLLLFNVRVDPAERVDLVQTETPRARAMRQLLAAWEADVDAESGRAP